MQTNDRKRCQRVFSGLTVCEKGSDNIEENPLDWQEIHSLVDNGKKQCLYCCDVKALLHVPELGRKPHMSENQRQPALFTHIDVTSQSMPSTPSGNSHDLAALMTQLIVSQNRQNELLEQLIQQMSAAQKQRANELGQWKQANPELAKRCRSAAETLGQVQTRFLETVTEEIADNGESMMDGEFMLNEFVDRFGPRLAHLNGVLQVLSQLSAVAANAESSK